MVRLSEILRRQETERAQGYIYKPVILDKTISSMDSQRLTAEGLYQELLNLNARVLSDIFNAKPLDLTGLRYKIDLVREFIAKDDGALLRLMEGQDSREDYIVVHSVNVCILSLEIARGLNYNPEATLDLGVGAFLHDIGMVKVMSILQNARQLYTAEYEEVKNHVTYGVDMLTNLGQINERILSIVSQHHERKDGSGYLAGLKDSQIDEYARIVGLADVYEALIHSRPHREGLVPFEYETIREIISNRNMFDSYILRVFLERLTRQPAYMLWLTANGVYKLLEEKTAQTLDAQTQPEARPAAKKKYILLAGILAVILLGILSLKFIIPGNETLSISQSSLSIGGNRQPLKIGYNFMHNPTNILSVSLDLSGINLAGYQSLTFSSKLDDKIINKIRYAALRINLENARREAGDYYIQGIDKRWKEFNIPLSYFPSIKDWSSLVSASFILEPWNFYAKEGVLYIDDIHFVKRK